MPHYATLCHIIYVCITLSSSFQTLPHSQKHHCASILYRSQRKLQKQNGNIHYQGTLATGPSNKSKSSLFRSFASLSTFPILFYLSRFPYLHPIFASPSYILTASVKRIHHIFIYQNISYRLRIFPHDCLMPRAVPVIQIRSYSIPQIPATHPVSMRFTFYRSFMAEWLTFSTKESSAICFPPLRLENLEHVLL